MNGHRRRAYLLLETTIATGVLIAALAVIGAQVQQADTSIKEMELGLRALLLGEMKLAELDLGLVELDSVDPIQEEDFGPRFPDFGWRLIMEEAAIDELYELQFEVLYLRRDGDYEPDDFDHEDAQVLHTLYALRPLPQKVDMREELGLPEEKADELCTKLDEVGLSCEEFDYRFLGGLPLEELIEKLPLIADAFGIDLSRMLGQLPPELRTLLEDAGDLGEGDAEDEEDESGEEVRGGTEEDEDS